MFNFIMGSLQLVNFVVALFAALVALQLYSLLRTGSVGRTWKILIVGAVILVVHAVAAFMIHCFPEGVGTMPFAQSVSEVLKTAFVFTLAWGLWMQRQAFYAPWRYRDEIDEEDIQRLRSRIREIAESVAQMERRLEREAEGMGAGGGSQG